MAKIPLKAAGAFVWSLMVKAMKKLRPLPISYLHAKFEQNQSVNGYITFYGCCGLFWPLLLQAYEIYQEQFPISYLQAKFENIDNEWQIYI